MYGLGDVIYEDAKEIKRLKDENEQLRRLFISVFDDIMKGGTNIFSKDSVKLLMDIVANYITKPKGDD